MMYFSGSRNESFEKTRFRKSSRKMSDKALRAARPIYDQDMRTSTYTCPILFRYFLYILSCIFVVIRYFSKVFFINILNSIKVNTHMRFIELCLFSRDVFTVKFNGKMNEIWSVDLFKHDIQIIQYQNNRHIDCNYESSLIRSLHFLKKPGNKSVI